MAAPSSSRNSEPIPRGRLAMEIATMETTSVPATKIKRKAGNLCSCPIFIVPIYADPSADFFCCPPGQQVLELQVTTNLFRSIKCNDQMENGVTAQVIRHVTQPLPNLFFVFFIECRCVCVVYQLINGAAGTTMLRRIFDGAFILGI